MSQILLDEQLDFPELLSSLQKWITAETLPALRPGERVLDDRVPALLRALKPPTFVTIDRGFWDRRWCDPNYAVLYFALQVKEQTLLPGLLRAALHQPEFRTRALRMGKVARVSTAAIEYWQYPAHDLHRITWGVPSPRKR